MNDTKEKVKHGLGQMKFEMVNNGVMDLPTSTPALYQFTSEATLSEESFEKELDDYDFVTLDTYTTENENGFYYKTKVLTDHSKDCIVKVWNDEARIFPRGQCLDRYELARILHALEAAFDATLEGVDHD